MACYENSPEKHKNREFKAVPIYNALEYFAINRQFNFSSARLFSLCGPSVWTEKAAATKATDLGLKLFVYPFVNDEKEYQTVCKKECVIGGIVSLPKEATFVIKNEGFSPILHTKGERDFIVDYDTCDGFTASIAKNSLAMCANPGALLILITVIIGGNNRTKDEDRTPISGLPTKDTRNAFKIGNWLESRGKLKFIGVHEYINPEGKHPMATIVMGREDSWCGNYITLKDMSKKKEKKTERQTLDSKIKQFALSLIKRGYPTKDIATKLNLNYRSLVSQGAWLVGKLAAKKKNKKSS